jgi:hypothetical protein
MTGREIPMEQAIMQRRTTLVFSLIAISLIAFTPHGRARAEEPAKAQNPHGSFAEDCALCHTSEGWKPVKIGRGFDHARFGFALEGSHAVVSCRACHESMDFSRTGSACVSCHQDIHRGELGTDCARCHSTRNFIEHAGDIRMHRLTRFPLLGAHTAVACDSCHTPSPTGQMRYVNTPTECEVCHLETFTATTDPDHVRSGFASDCSRCHSTVSWQGSRFNHDLAGFPLEGAHRALQCEACHVGNDFTGASAECLACHERDYRRTTNPDHAVSGIPDLCQDCHSTRAWRPADFRHGRTGFRLTGAHRAADCNDCHGDGVYAGKDSACVSCHQRDYNRASNPDHQAAGFSTDCADCHGTVSWGGGDFDHDSAFFPIYSGPHKGKWSECATCHVNSGNFAAFSCFGCHPHSDRKKTNEKHKGEPGYSYDSRACYNCHPRGRHE